MEEKFYQKSAMQCLASVSSSANGLGREQAAQRTAEAAKMQIQPAKKQGFWSKFFAQIKELMVLVLLISGLVSIVIGVVENSSSEIVDGAIILGIVVMNALFGVFQERKSERAIESLKNLTQPEAFVLREGRVAKLKTSDLVIGDVVCLDAGCIVPADLRLLSDAELRIDEASLTGESEAVQKFSDVVFEKDVPLAERKNMAYAGSIVESGNGKGVVVALGKNTEIGKIAQSLQTTKKDLTPLQKNIQGVGKVLTFLILLMATITFVLEVISNPKQILTAFLTAVAISVAAIPESMPAVITIIMSLGIAKLSRQKAIVKRLNAVETLGACDVVCSDKTGTITQNKMKAVETFSFFDRTSRFFDVFLNSFVLCNDCRMGFSGFVGGSTEVALAEYAKDCGVDKIAAEKNFPRLEEEPFSSKTKYMLTLNDVRGEKICFLKGALDRVLGKCKYYCTNNQILPLTDQTRAQILAQNNKMCQNALRVISFAFCKTQHLEKDMQENFVFLGLCGLQDPPRPEIADAVKKCRKAGMRPIMITGDFRETAFAIAKQVGIATSQSQVMSGEEIDAVADEDEFANIVEQKCVFARVSPAHKVRIVKALKSRGHITAMTGDGVNDAPSLKNADIGIGMGKSGTDVVKDVADIIITDDNFATIIVAVEEGRKIYSNIQKTIKYLFSANMAEILSLFLITILLPGRTFLLPVQILFVNLITDSLPAIALGTEAVEKQIMDQPPRKKSQGLFGGGMGTSLLVLGLVQTALVMAAYLFGLFVHNEAVAITMAFYTLNFIQLFYMFTARTNNFCFKSNPFKNKFFNISLLAGFGLLAVIATTGFSKILSLQPLSATLWAVVLALSVSVIFVGELYKLVEKLLFGRNKKDKVSKFKEKAKQRKQKKQNKKNKEKGK